MSDALAKGTESQEIDGKDESAPGHIRQRNRALILSAAEEVFAQQGYRGATTWLGELDRITEASDPASALADYIRAKIRHSRERPLASKVYANEMIRGARHTRDFLKNELRNLVKEKSKVLEAWMAAGRIDPVDPVHLFSIIWAATQHYADFEVQVGALVGRRQLAAKDYDEAAETIVRMVLRGCGLDYAGPASDTA